MPVVAQEALHRPCSRFAKRADRVTFDLAGSLLEHVDVAKLGLAFDDARQKAVHPARAFTTRRALPAGFGVIKPRNAMAGTHHAGVLVHDDDRTRTEAGTGLLDRVIVH